MLRLNFNIFIKKLSDNMQPLVALHCLEEIDKFTFIFRAKDGWKYYSIVTDKDISEFSEFTDMPLDAAINRFRLNYCSNAIPLSNKDIEYLRDEIQEELFEEEDEIDINKMISEEESKGYSEFILKLFNQFEASALKAVDKIKLDKKLNKSFSEFITSLFNGVNSLSFMKNIKKYISIDLNKGLGTAENELNMDIGKNSDYELKLNQLTQQQIDGYTINGKKWFGIKGVTKEIQSTIIQTVQSGIKEEKSLLEIKDAIKQDFNKFSDWRANMIARTETTRIINEGKLIGYKESGITGVKVWKTAPYEAGRSSEICQRLKGQVQKLDDPFIDPGTNKAFMAPGAHPNCRSTIFFKPD